MCEPDSVQYLRDLIQEKDFLNNIEGHTILKTLLDQEISRMQCGGRPPGSDSSYVDVYNEKPVRVSTKVLVPVKQHPKFNFVGKLLGPRGSSLKQLQSSSMTKMAILGRGSMRNTAQEEELRASTDPKHGHLNEDLHVEISTFASPAEAHARVALALSEVRAYLIPDSNDQIRLQQMRDIKIIKMAGAPLQITNEVDAATTADDSGHDSDVSNSPTPPKHETCHIHVPTISPKKTQDTCNLLHVSSSPTYKPVTGSNRSIFNKLFTNHVSSHVSNHVSREPKRPNFPPDIYSPLGCEPICKRFKQ